MSDQRSHEVNLLDLIAFVLRWRVFLISAVLSVAVVVAVISFLLLPKYRSTAVIRSHESTGTSIGSLIASKLGGLGGLASFVPPMGEIPEQTYVTLLKSRWMSERVIEHFDLRTVYKMRSATMDQVVKALLSNTDFQLDDKTLHIIITVDDHDASRAKSMVDYYIDELDQRNQELKSSGARKEKEFLAQRLAAEQDRLAALEDSMYRFQLATGVLNVEEQVKATIGAAAQLEAQRLMIATEMEMNNRLLGSESPETRYMRLKLASIDSTMLELVQRKKPGEPNDFLLRLQDIPGEGATYLRLTRDIEIQQLLVGYILQQYEQAKIEELRNTPTVMRLDPPVVPSKRVWPRRGMMVVLSALGAFILAAAIAMIIEMVRHAKDDPAHPQHERLVALGHAWKRR
jgi:tyrosine-protein kinase Etk/Wzc